LSPPTQSIKGSSSVTWLRPGEQTASSRAFVSRFVLPHPASQGLPYFLGAAARTVCKQTKGLSKTVGSSEGAAGFNLEMAMLL